jgi:hypothetical protein
MAEAGMAGLGRLTLSRRERMVRRCWYGADHDARHARRDRRCQIWRRRGRLERGFAIHVTEVAADLIPLHGLSAASLFSLCAADPRMRVNQAQYLYLAEWDGPRRESVSEAVEAVLSAASGPLRLDEIAARVESRVHRSCERTAISGCLRAMEAVWDEATEQWSQGGREEFASDDDLVLSA